MLDRVPLLRDLHKLLARHQRQQSRDVLEYFLEHRSSIDDMRSKHPTIFKSVAHPGTKALLP